jgi:hypothetical protein
MIDRVDQHADPEHVRGQDELLPLGRAQLPGAREPVDRGCPFRLGRLDVADEPVQMPDQRLHDLPQTRVGDILPALERDVGEIVLGHIGHGWLLNSRTLRIRGSEGEGAGR